jgi:hypothetical protein
MPRRRIEDETPPWEEEDEAPKRRTVPAERVNNGGQVQKYQAPRELVPGYGNIDTTDLVVPRIKLLQGMSPETKPAGGGHPQGQWFHSSEGRCIGDALTIVSLGIKKTVEMWGPRNSDHEDDGILARSSDGVHWDPGHDNKTFVITFDDGHQETWRTKSDVEASGVCKFRDGRPPIAGYTYRLALYLPDFEQYHASLYIASRTATQGVVDMNGRVNSRHIGGTPFYAQQYRMRAQTRRSGKIEWFVPAFDNLPALTDKRLIEELRERAAVIYKANVTTFDEDERLAGGDGGGGRAQKRPQGRERNRESNY